LYDRYGGLAHTVASALLSDRGAAEDVVQESFLTVWRRGSTFQPGRGSLRSWICTIVRNRAIDRLRGDRHRTRLDTPIDDESIEPAVTDPWVAVAIELSGEEVARRSPSFLPKQRQTIELAYYAGYSQSEIAKAMEVPLGT